MMFLAKLLTDSVTLTQFGVPDETKITSTNIPTHYNTLDGNLPRTYTNTAFLWQTDGWDTSVTLTQSKVINSDLASGPFNFNELSLSNVNYLLGYGVGPDQKSIVTTLRLEAQGDGKYTVTTAPEEEALSFTMTDINTTTVSFTFRIPAGRSAEGDGDWIGVWKGSTGSNLYNETKQPLALRSLEGIDDSYGEGILSLPDGEQFQSGASHMLGYFKGGYNEDDPTASVRTTLAAIIKFKAP